MKSLFKFVIVLLIAGPLQAQKEDIKTYSVTLDNFINFIVNTYDHQISEKDNDKDHNIVFLIQVANNDTSIEDMIILKQGFKLISERLSDNNTVSILTYFGYNGVAMDGTVPSELNKIYGTLSDLKTHVNEFHGDGIELAYKYVNENYEEDKENSIVILRNPNTSNLDVMALTRQEIKKIKRKKKKKDILKVAVSVLPEIIAILKN